MAEDAMAISSTIEIDSYVVRTLMRDLVGHDRSPSAFLVYLLVSTETASARTSLSHAALAQRTGLSKRACQNAVALLSRRWLIEISRAAPTEPAQYSALRPWTKEA